MFKKALILQSLIVLILTGFTPSASADSVWDLDLRGAVTTQYDDNVTSANTNEKEDFVTNLLAGFNAVRQAKTYLIELIGDFRQQLFAKDSDFNNMSQDARINIQKEFSKYDRITVSHHFEHSEDPASFDDNFGRTSGRYSYYRNTFDVKYVHDISKQLAVDAFYGNQSYEVSRDDLTDSWMNRAGFNLSYFQTSTTVFLLGYQFLTRNYDPGGDLFIHNLVGGLRHFFTSQLYVDSRVGVSFVEQVDGSDSREPNFTISVTNEFTETDAATLSFSQTTTAGSNNSDLFDAWRIALSIRRQLLERLSAGLTLFFGEGDYEALGISDEQIGISARLGYEVTEDVRAFISYTFNQVDSNIDSRGYDRNLVQVGVRISF